MSATGWPAGIAGEDRKNSAAEDTYLAGYLRGCEESADAETTRRGLLEQRAFRRGLNNGLALSTLLWALVVLAWRALV